MDITVVDQISDLAPVWIRLPTPKLTFPSSQKNNGSIPLDSCELIGARLHDGRSYKSLTTTLNTS